MSWFSSLQSVPIDDKIAEASSSLIPNGGIDLIKALEISDLIRSKQTYPKDAMRSLKKRFMTTRNPNVQKSSLKLIDFCIKNGGELFVLEISSKEFLDPLVVLLSSNTLNDEVKSSALELIQNWSLLFSKNPKLSYITTIYDKLSKDGFQFPSIYGAELNESFLESKVAAEWVDSDACMICSDLFTVLNRKHHCRACGGVFCGKHSANSIPLPEFGITIPVRVCDNCYEPRKQKHLTHKSHHAHSNSNSHHHQQSLTSPSKNDIKLKNGLEDEDEDLKRAIELSLKESGMFVPPLTSAPLSNDGVPTSVPQPINGNETDDDDEDMKRAIEASLRDLKVSEPASEENPYSNILPGSSNDVNYYNQSNFQPFVSSPQAFTQQQQQPLIPPQTDQITLTDEDNINLLANLLDRYNKNSNDNNIYQDEEIQALHNNITALRPKLNKSINDSVSKYDQFIDMHSKVGTIMRLYDGILQAHMTSMYDNQQQQQQQEQQQHQQHQQQQQPQQQFYNNYHPQQPQSPSDYYQQQSQLPQQLQYDSHHVSSQQQQITLPSYPPVVTEMSDLQGAPLSPVVTRIEPLRTDTPSYPPVSNEDIPSFPPVDVSSSNLRSPQLQLVSPRTSLTSPPQSFEIPSYPPHVTQKDEKLEEQPVAVGGTTEQKYDFPGLPVYPAFESTPLKKLEPQQETKDETPLIEL